MNRPLKRCLPTTFAGLIALSGVLSPAAWAAGTANAQPDPRIELATQLPGARVDDLRNSPVPGIYELRNGANISYVTSDGKFVFAGDLYRMVAQGDFQNLTEQRRRELRVSMLAVVPESQMMIFAPKNPKYTVTVFTDVDCVYCVKLHSHIAEYNRLGVKVRYMFYPRSGPNTASWAKAEQVWCSSSRNEALTRAKLGEQLKTQACGQTPVRRHFELGRNLGVEATPGLVLSNGELHLGYLDPAQMLKQLQAAAR